MKTKYYTIALLFCALVLGCYGKEFGEIGRTESVYVATETEELVRDNMEGLNKYLYSDSATQPAGDVLNILLLGQSNAHGAPGTNVIASMPSGLQSGEDPRLTKAWLTWYGKPGDANNYRLHHVKPWSYSPTSQIWGPEVFGGWGLANQDYHTVITKATIGGVPIETFLPGGAGWDLMTNNYAITESERAAEGIPPLGAVDVLWWGQGEQLSSPTGNYYNDLTNLIAQIKTEFSSPDMKVVFMGLNKRYADGYESDAAFIQYVSENPDDSYYVATKDLHVRGDSGLEPLDVHYSGLGQKDLGYRMANGTIAMIEDDPTYYTLDVGKTRAIEGEFEKDVILTNGGLYADEIHTTVFNTYGDSNATVRGNATVTGFPDGMGESYHWKGYLRGTTPVDRNGVVLTSIEGLYTYGSDSDLHLMNFRGQVWGTSYLTQHSTVRLLKCDDFIKTHGGIWTISLAPTYGGGPIGPYQIYRLGSTGNHATSYGTPILTSDAQTARWQATVNETVTVSAGDVVQCGTNGVTVIVDEDNGGATTFYIRQYYDTDTAAYTAAPMDTTAPLIINGVTNATARITATNGNDADFRNMLYMASDGVWFLPESFTAYEYNIKVNYRDANREDLPPDFPPEP